MLLRRVIEHVKTQNWTAVALDFVIVVVGVFIGIQVANWNAEQSNRKLERHYLERLIEDMDESIARTKRGQGFVEYNQTNAWVVQKSLTDCRIPKGREDQFADGLFQIGRFRPVSYELGTVNELQSAGNFSIIRNPDIRAQLTTLVSDAKAYSDLLQPISSRVSLQFAQLDRHIIVTREHIKPLSGSVTMDEVQIDFQSMCDDQEVLPALSMVRTVNQFHIDRYERALETLAETRGVLVEELGFDPESFKP